MAGIYKAYDIRGIYPEQLDEATTEAIGRAFVAFLGGARRVVVGRDMRPHSAPLFAALAKGMTEQGADVIDLGLCSTPMSYFANGKLGADGSVIITASHNSAEWNGFKLCRAGAVPISGSTGIADIERIVAERSWGPPAARPGTVTRHDIGAEYGAHLRRFAKLDRKLKVVCDFANAMGSLEIAGIRDLFEIIPMYEELDGSFPNHEANPLKTETLDALCAKVRETGADFGAGFDGDSDRCGFVDDRGEIIPMDLFTALIAQDLLTRNPGATILYDLRSSRAVRECIEANGGKAVMSRVGHAFIKAQMREHDAIFAGELSGHYYFKENYTAESQGLAFLLLANLICRTGRPVSRLVEPLRKYHASGEINSRVADPAAVIARIKAKYGASGRMFELDGVSVEFPDWWFNVRTSNTEPLLRLIVEADTAEKMVAERDRLVAIIRG
jgi:phosphomannomutase